jgi:hypothetical protein
MFLRANARRGGLVYRGEPFQAIYAAAFRDGRLIGVAAHCWNGIVLVQAPEETADVARASVASSGRTVTGLSGPREQVNEARSALGLSDVEAALEGDEALYALDLPDLIVPAALSSGAIVCRAPRPDERDTLVAWRNAYDIETLGATDSPEQRPVGGVPRRADRGGECLGRDRGRRARVALRLQRRAARHRAARRHLHAARPARPRLCEGRDRGVAPGGARPRGVARRPLHQQPERRADV